MRLILSLILLGFLITSLIVVRARFEAVIKPVKAAVPVGYFDQVSCTQITGWAGDPDTPNQQIYVDFYANGPAGVGIFIGRVLANGWREAQVCQILGGTNCAICDSNPHPSISTAPQCYHAYTFTTPNSLKDGQPHSIYAHGINTDGTPNNPALNGSGVQITCPAQSDITTSVSLNNLGLGTVNLYISYDSPSAVGDPYPNYEYSGHILKISATDYRMIYGGRCYYDSNRNCQVPVNGNYPNPNPTGGDGDHPRYATSSDGENWTRSLTPLVRPGRFDISPVPPSNYDYGNHMDPTVIRWNNLYYMYYQVEVRSDQNPNCPKDPNQTVSACDRILYATSTDLVNWTKGQPIGTPVIVNDHPEDHFAWPKAIVVDGQIWLYYGYYKYGYGGQFLGAKLIKSSNPISFDLNQAISVSGYGGWSQHGVLFPNDLTRRTFVGVVNNWTITNSTGHKVPTLAFSRDGIYWFNSDSGKEVDFPPVMLNLQHEFCNIGTELNGGLNPIASNPNTIQTFYYCATTNGNNPDIFNSNIAVGKLYITYPPKATPAPTPVATPKPTPAPTSRPTPAPTPLFTLNDMKPTLLNYTADDAADPRLRPQDGKVNLLDVGLVIQSITP